MISNALELEWGGLNCLFLKEKAMFIPVAQTLIVADVHFGKFETFRKNGIAAPEIQTDFIVLNQLIREYNPLKIIFLGDLFHSKNINIVERFKTWRSRFSHIQFLLTEGNHDILNTKVYHSLNVDVKEKNILNDVVLTHHPISEGQQFNIAGHLHPAIKLSGPARQKLRLPCFWIKQNQLIMPAFGSTTGMYDINVVKGHKVIAISEAGLSYFE